ncbi:MAG: hypothetical protein P0Y56_13090 [Candidatus Andeanibacterium colombiense]|uniref:DUF4235 domain-containing protein n=1 Tax=Candidatus Andeanibacterium colombiense TaxID=3121345 RepID=A0AAJ6BP21_9SPHN|nr:MAG: hypothetical protein P0Y56_13090 [Sphingomonadaceae bacterium]
MAKKIEQRFDDAVDGTGADGEDVRETFFGSLARSAASAAVSVTVTFAVGWLLRKLADRANKAGGAESRTP